MVAEGWSWLINSKKDHYFVNGQSLCGHWLRLSNKDLYEHSDNKCKRCEQLAERRVSAGITVKGERNENS